MLKSGQCSTPVDTVVAKKLNDATRMMLMLSEAVADKALIKPATKALFEIDCPNDMDRLITGQVTSSDGQISTVKARSWEHIPPESNGAGLALLACRRN